jgi:protease-4
MKKLLVVSLVLLFGISETYTATTVGVLKIRDKVADDASLIKKLYDCSVNPTIQAVLILINSGGGKAALGELYYREIKALSANKPVVVLVEGKCCSAAYLAAVAADWIITPTVGYIGSIGSFVTIDRHKNPKHHDNGYSADLEREFVYAGKFKIDGHPNAAQSISDEMRDRLQKLVDADYQIFIEIVARERNLSLDQASEWADAQAFNGDQALEKGLVDQIGGFTDAVNKVKELIAVRGGTVENQLVFVE